MGWQDDLIDLVDGLDPETVVGWATQPLAGARESIDESGLLGVPGAALQAAGGLLGVASVPVKFGTGLAIGGINRGLGALDRAGVPGAGFAYEPETERAFAEGGPLGAWEQVRSEEPMWFQGITELGIDPLTYTGIGAGVNPMIKAINTMADAATNPLARTALRGAALPYQGMQAFNDLPGQALSHVIQPAVRGLKKPIEAVWDDAFKAAPDEVDAALRDQLDIADLEARSVTETLPMDGAVSPTRLGAERGAGSMIFAREQALAGMSDDSRALLTTPMKDGRLAIDFIDEAERQAAADIATLRAAGVQWDPTAPGNVRLKAAEESGDPEAVRIVKRYNKEKIDPLSAEGPRGVAKTRYLRQIATDEKREYAAPSNWDLFRSMWSEVTLVSGRYLSNNLVGGMLQLGLSGTRPIYGFKEQQAMWRLARNGVDSVTSAETLANMPSTQFWRGLGYARPPGWIFRGGAKQMTYNPSRAAPTATGELVGKITKNPDIARKASWIVKANNDAATSLDWIMRDTKAMDVARVTLDAELPKWEEAVRQRLPAGTAFAAQGAPTSPPSFFKAPLQAHLEGLGIRKGDAEHLTNQYLNVRRTVEETAREQTNKTIFAGDRTNFEKALGKFVPFTYWASRAQRFYWETALRHPPLLLNYLKLHEGLEAAEADPGLDARQKGFLHVANTGLGYSLLMNPDALFGVVKVLNFDGDYEPDGQTKLGKMLTWMRDNGIGAYPWYNETFNLMGMYGNTFEPDLLPVRQKGLVGSVINAINAHTGGQPIGSPLQNAGGQLRYQTSQAVASALPDQIGPFVTEEWFQAPVTPKAGGSQQEASLDKVLENIIAENNQGITNGDLMLIMTDPEHPEYQQAYKQASLSGVVQQFLNFVMPTNFRMRHDRSDQDYAAVEIVKAEADKRGVPPFKITPELTDLEFAANFKKQTGREWTPTAYLDAKDRYDLTRAPTEAKRFLIQEQQYNALGTEKQRKLNSKYQAIRNGDDPISEGVTSPVVREQLAAEWLTSKRQVGAVQELQNQRNLFETQYAEFGGFKNWQSAMYNLREHMGGSLEEYRRLASEQNPNARDYFASNETWVKEHFPQEEWADKLDEFTVNANAYQAIHGMATLRAAQGPVPGVPGVDVTLPGYQAAMMPPPTPDWMEELRAMGGRAPF